MRGFNRGGGHVRREKARRCLAVAGTATGVAHGNGRGRTGRG